MGVATIHKLFRDNDRDSNDFFYLGKPIFDKESDSTIITKLTESEIDKEIYEEDRNMSFKVLSTSPMQVAFKNVDSQFNKIN